MLCNKEKYNKVSPDLLHGIFNANLSHISSDGKITYVKPVIEH